MTDQPPSKWKMADVDVPAEPVDKRPLEIKPTDVISRVGPTTWRRNATHPDRLGPRLRW